MSSKKHIGIRHMRGVAILSAAVLLGVACGGDDGGSTSTEAPAESAAPSTDAPETTDGSDTSAPAENVGNRDGQTIKVGLVNNDALLPAFRTGAEVAIEAINADGGINGAQIEVVSCTADASPEGSINCANQMIEENVAIAYTALDLGSDAANPIYDEAGIPYITTNGWGTVQESNENSFILHAASSASFLGPLKTFKDLGLTKVGYVTDVNFAGTPYETKLKNYSEILGLEVTPIYLDAANPDWTSAVANFKSQGIEAITGFLGEIQCIGLVSATTAVGFEGAVFASSCNLYLDVVPDLALGTYNQADIWTTLAYDEAPAEIQARLDEYIANMTAGGHEALISGFAQVSYGGWMELREILSAIPNDQEINGESVKATIVSQVFPGYFGPDLQCGKALWADSPSACHASIAVFQIEKAADGRLIRKLYSDFADNSALVGGE